MKTIILPGYSSSNKEWAENVAGHLTANGLQTMVHCWLHWDKRKAKSLSLKKEKERILKLFGNDKVNLIAKSVGTRVLMSLVEDLDKQINKVILCGIPIDPVRYIKGIKKLGYKRLLIIQNKKDPFMPAKAITLFMKLVDKKVKVMEKDRSDHDYPYSSDFIKFLKG